MINYRGNIYALGIWKWLGIHKNPGMHENWL